jgi:signal transduction histidine kinase
VASPPEPPAHEPHWGWLRLLDYFSPPDFDPETRRRSRLIVAVAFGLCLFALPLAVQLYVTLGRFSPTMAVFVVGALVMAANPFILKRTGALRLVGVVVCLELIASLVAQSFFNGGIASASMIWCLTVPVIASFVVGPRFAAACAGIIVALTAAIYVAGESGIVFPRPLSDAQMRWWAMAGLSSATMFAALLAWLYESSRAVATAASDEALAKLKQANLELERARDAAEQAAAAKQAFVANMSHEIRTPLNAVIGMTGLLVDTDLDERQSELAATARRSGETLLELVNDILDFSKIEAGHVQLENRAFRLSRCIEEAIDVAATAVVPEVELSHSLTSEVPEFVSGDEHRLKQILLNLLSNAAKFTHRGRIAVEVSKGDEPSFVRLVVRDTGIGIPAERLQDVMQSFTQVDASTTRRYGGTGLGLAIVNQLVDLMRGKLSLRSEVDVGTTFELRVPLPETAEPDEQVATPRRLSVTRSTLKILVAEDNIVNQKVALAMLERLGYGADVANNGREAVDAVERGAYDLVLMDMQMPELDGLAATRALRARDEATPYVVAMTANATEDDRRACMDAGMNAFIAKPVRQGELEALLAELG